MTRAPLVITINVRQRARQCVAADAIGATEHLHGQRVLRNTKATDRPTHGLRQVVTCVSNRTGAAGKTVTGASMTYNGELAVTLTDIERCR